MPTPSASVASQLHAPRYSASGQVPAHCELVAPQSGLAVIVCQPPSEGFWAKATPSFPALGTSFLALVLSILALRYNFAKDARARQQSIQDDFWLRKVVSPVSIEPFVKFVGEVLSKLPDGQSDGDMREKFKQEQLTNLKSLIAGFRALELINKDLYSQVETKLELVEDLLISYLSNLNEHIKNPSSDAPGKPEFIEELSALRLAVLDPIKEHQASVGLTNAPRR